MYVQEFTSAIIEGLLTMHSTMCGHELQWH